MNDITGIYIIIGICMLGVIVELVEENIKYSNAVKKLKIGNRYILELSCSDNPFDQKFISYLTITGIEKKGKKIYVQYHYDHDNRLECDDFENLVVYHNWKLIEDKK